MKGTRAAIMAIFFAALVFAPGMSRAGKVGGVLARYCLGGVGVGALLGTVAATVPYLNDKQPFDFAVGAGAGALTGVGMGLIFGVVDLATDQDPGTTQTSALAKPLQGIYAFNMGSKTCLGWRTTF